MADEKREETGKTDTEHKETKRKTSFFFKVAVGWFYTVLHYLHSLMLSKPCVAVPYQMTRDQTNLYLGAATCTA